jgi:glutaredoxin 3
VPHYTFRMNRPHVKIFTSDFCSYCVRAKNLLTTKGVDYEEVHFPRHDFQARQSLVELTGRYTVPQILIDGRPIGGYDDLRALDDAGGLDGLLGRA